jgi:hypothetical protein
MKRPHLNPSPNQLATISLTCILIATAIFLIPAMTAHPSVVVIIALLATLLICLGLAVWAISRLKSGVRCDLWTEVQLARLRGITVSRMYTRTWLVLLVVFFVFSLLHILKQVHQDIGWPAYIVAMYMIQLRGAAKPPTLSAPSAPRIEWNNVAPIRSQHWGER